MRIEEISEQEFFEGLNDRIADLAEEIEKTGKKIRNNPDSSTYHIDNFFYPLNVMRKLQQIRDKAKAFKENEDEPVVYVRKDEPDGAKYFYLPKSRYDQSRLSETIRQMERTTRSESDLGYIN